MTDADQHTEDWPVAQDEGEGQASAWSTGLTLSGAALRRRIRERFTEPAALRGSYRRAQATPLYTLTQEEGGAAERGRRVMRGVFTFAGATLEPKDQDIWSLTPPSRAWLAELHKFNWLRDLAAVGGARPQALAGDLALRWLHRASRYDPLVWSPLIAATRLRAWLVYSDMLPLDAENGAKLTRSAIAHLDWLQRRGVEAGPGLPALTVSVATVEAALTLEAASSRYEASAKRLDDILEASLLEDGGLLGRSPLDCLVALEQLGLLLLRCEEAGAPVSASLRDAPMRLCQALRFFRVSDGGLPLFHGAEEVEAGRLDAALTRYKVPSAPARALPESGYVRMIGGRVAVIVDAASAPAATADRAHASALSLEMTSGRRRLVVNAGSGAHLNPKQARASRSASAHSTLTLDSAPFASEAASRNAAGDELLSISGPPEVASNRKEERNGVWVMASHNGYEAEYGATVTRRLFLSTDGGDFRGEDTISAEGAAARKIFESRLTRLPRQRRERGFIAEARFHLHPELSAALVAEGEAATLRLPHGEVWVMRQSGGALSIEDSVYYGRGGATEAASSLVIRFDVGAGGGRIRWAFRRVGDMEQLPRDFDALLPDLDGPEKRRAEPQDDELIDRPRDEPPRRR